MGKDLVEMSNVLKGVPDSLQPIFKEVHVQLPLKLILCIQACTGITGSDDVTAEPTASLTL